LPDPDPDPPPPFRFPARTCEFPRKTLPGQAIFGSGRVTHARDSAFFSVFSLSVISVRRPADPLFVRRPCTRTSSPTVSSWKLCPCSGEFVRARMPAGLCLNGFAWGSRAETARALTSRAQLSFGTNTDFLDPGFKYFLDSHGIAVLSSRTRVLWQVHHRVCRVAASTHCLARVGRAHVRRSRA
jgi:hypothetical protein